MKKEIKLLCGFLFSAAILSQQLCAMELKIRSDKDVASGASKSATLWYPGGISGRWLAVGNPNKYNRNDKVVFRFPLAGFISRGSVKKAVLRFRVHTDKRNTRKEDLVLEHFTTDRRILTAQSLITQEVKELGQVASLAPGKNVIVKMDVTSAVNNDIEKGYPFIGFRVTSITAEKYGAPGNGIINCASIVKNSIVLDVIP